LLAKATGLGETQATAQLRIIAQLRVRIQREVIGEQADVV
jgi:hypothetical protein